MIGTVRGGVTIEITVVPRAGRTMIAGTRDNTVLVRLAAAPVEGAANDALIELLADACHVAKRQVSIVSGAHGRRKRVQIDGVTEAQITAALVPGATRSR